MGCGDQSDRDQTEREGEVLPEGVVVDQPLGAERLPDGVGGEPSLTCEAKKPSSPTGVVIRSSRSLACPC